MSRTSGKQGLLKDLCLLVLGICMYVRISIGAPGARVIYSCEPPDVDTGNQTQVLFKSRTHLRLTSPQPWQ